MATNWVLFAVGADAGGVQAPDARVTRYFVERCVPVVGEVPSIEPETAVLRIESSAPVDLAGVPVARQFRGTAQHLNYTARAQRADLEVRSRGPFDDPAGVVCVMIPIAKSAAWWQLPPEERAGHFQQAAAHHQHVAIGAPYVERIYRKLYHSRYASGPEAPIPYDFVTYFEFLEADRGAFEELLAGLRDTKRNPEWGFVEHEFEVWMRRA